MEYLSRLLALVFIPGMVVFTPLLVDAKPVNPNEPLQPNPLELRPTQTQQQGAKPIYRVPIIRRSSGVPVIGVSFNGNSTVYPLLLDTAASVTVISPEIARQVNWEQTGTVEAALSSGERITVPVGRVRSIQVGGTNLENFVVAVGPVPLLGANFHSQFSMLITPEQILLRPNQEEQKPQSPRQSPLVKQ